MTVKVYVWRSMEKLHYHKFIIPSPDGKAWMKGVCDCGETGEFATSEENCRTTEYGALVLGNSNGKKN